MNLDDCWLFAGHINYKGYGYISVWKIGTFMAHRVMYENTIGEIPKGLVIDHLCRVRHCINPRHLEVVSNHENILRGLPHRITAKITNKCHKGHNYTPENTYLHTNGSRVCKTCRRVSYARYRHRNRGRYDYRGTTQDEK